MDSSVSPPIATSDDAAPVVLSGGRLANVDFLRGLVMVLMVLDHSRDFFGDARLDPTDFVKFGAPLFLTRWVTHFCAPIFVFLAGTGAYFSRALGKLPTSGALASFLAKRGLFLVVLEWTLVHWGWNFNLHYRVVVLQVIWVIGLSMLLLAALVWLDLSPRRIGVVGVFIIVGHNLIDLGLFRATSPDPGSWDWLWTILLRPGAIQPSSGMTWVVAYPLLPWFGVMAAGFGFGELFLRGRRDRIRATTALGLAMVLSFVILRTANVYGDPMPWKTQDAGAQTILSFLNCQKYPPSLLYVLMTLGPGLLILAAYDRIEGDLPRPVGPIGRASVTLGRAPLFFYLLQWPVIHMMANLASTLSGQSVDWFTWSFDYPRGYGYSLPAIYAAWAIAIGLLYFPSRWFARYKRNHRERAWLSYF